MDQCNTWRNIHTPTSIDWRKQAQTTWPTSLIESSKTRSFNSILEGLLILPSPIPECLSMSLFTFWIVRLFVPCSWQKSTPSHTMDVLYCLLSRYVVRKEWVNQASTSSVVVLSCRQGLSPVLIWRRSFSRVPHCKAVVPPTMTRATMEMASCPGQVRHKRPLFPTKLISVQTGRQKSPRQRRSSFFPRSNGQAMIVVFTWLVLFRIVFLPIIGKWSP